MIRCGSYLKKNLNIFSYFIKFCLFFFFKLSVKIKFKIKKWGKSKIRRKRAFKRFRLFFLNKYINLNILWAKSYIFFKKLFSYLFLFKIFKYSYIFFFLKQNFKKTNLLYNVKFLSTYIPIYLRKYKINVINSKISYSNNFIVLNNKLNTINKNLIIQLYFLNHNYLYIPNKNFFFFFNIYILIIDTILNLLIEFYKINILLIKMLINYVFKKNKTRNIRTSRYS